MVNTFSRSVLFSAAGMSSAAAFQMNGSIPKKQLEMAEQVKLWQDTCARLETEVRDWENKSQNVESKLKQAKKKLQEARKEVSFWKKDLTDLELKAEVQTLLKHNRLLDAKDLKKKIIDNGLRKQLQDQLEKKQDKDFEECLKFNYGIGFGIYLVLILICSVVYLWSFSDVVGHVFGAFFGILGLVGIWLSYYFVESNSAFLSGLTVEDQRRTKEWWLIQWTVLFCIAIGFNIIFMYAKSL